MWRTLSWLVGCDDTLREGHGGTYGACVGGVGASGADWGGRHREYVGV